MYRSEYSTLDTCRGIAMVTFLATKFNSKSLNDQQPAKFNQRNQSKDKFAWGKFFDMLDSYNIFSMGYGHNANFFG